jgi:hypothetical protein
MGFNGLGDGFDVTIVHAEKRNIVKITAENNLNQYTI